MVQGHRWCAGGPSVGAGKWAGLPRRPWHGPHPGGQVRLGLGWGAARPHLAQAGRAALGTKAASRSAARCAAGALAGDARRLHRPGAEAEGAGCLDRDSGVSPRATRGGASGARHSSFACRAALLSMYSIKVGGLPCFAWWPCQDKHVVCGAASWVLPRIEDGDLSDGWFRRSRQRLRFDRSLDGKRMMAIRESRSQQVLH